MTTCSLNKFPWAGLRSRFLAAERLLVRRSARALYVVFLAAVALTAKAIEPERLFYLNNGEVLQGLVYKPQGDGPFPAVVYSQNTVKDWSKEKNPKPFPELAKFFTGHGYVLFAPGRRKWSDSDQEQGATNAVDSVEEQRSTVHKLELQSELVFAALETLKAQSFVDGKRLYVVGHASGGTAALIMAEKELDIRGYVIFSPAAGSWSKNAVLQSTLKRTVKNAKAPVFLIQAENDQSLLPAKVLGKELDQKGPPSQTKIYPPFGNSMTEATLFSVNGSAVWGEDVLAFFKGVAK